MPTTAKQLGDEYRKAVCACHRPVSSLDSDARWKAYLEALYSETGDVQVFGLMAKEPREKGGSLIYDYIRGEIDEQTLVAETEANSNVAYVASLRSSGILTEAPPEPAYSEMTHETNLELLKAYMPLRGMAPEESATCDAVAVRGSTIWFRFIELLHAMTGLPTVSEIRHVIAKLNPLEEDVLDTGDFSTYAMIDAAERATFEAILKGDEPSPTPATGL